MRTVGLVGARGHTGRELVSLLSKRADLGLVFASSRAMAGEMVTMLAPDAPRELRFEALGPGEVAAKRAEAVILALPNGEAGPYVDAIARTAPQTVIVDLSADFRFDDEWVYGLPEIHGRGSLRGAARIANPGCYATAGQLAVAPLREKLASPPHLFGVSGYSGAGTTPSRKNDTRLLQDNLMPYALAGHMHEREMSRHLGCDVRFSPHVAQFFRGLLVTAQMEFAEPLTLDQFEAAHRQAYSGEPLISFIDGRPAEIADGANVNGAAIGGWTLSADGRRGAVVCALDNLLKGAAVQAIQNLAIALGLEEFDGLV